MRLIMWPEWSQIRFDNRNLAVLTKGIRVRRWARERVRDILRQVCRESEVDLLCGVLFSDHVQMFVSVPSKRAI
ncbi:transposase, partial [Ruegeria sp. 2012CJ41-6]|nr:transposase [Ruegeria spongiae]